MKIGKILLISILFVSKITIAQETHNGERILVVGGGGARGAWGAGFAKYLDSLNRLKDAQFIGYKNVYGTSTGSLMAPLIVLDSFDKLERVYTTIDQKTIFSVNPFKKKTGKIKILKSAWRGIIGKESIGETKHLLHYMQNNLSEEEYDAIRKNSRYTVAVTNMKNGTVSYETSDSNDRKSMINWMWASANEPLFMSYYPKKSKRISGDAYVDGGVISNVPLMKALDYANHNKIDAIDVIVNKPKDALGDDTIFSKRDVFDGLLRLINLFTVQIRNNNIELAFLQDSISAYQSFTNHGQLPDKKNIENNNETQNNLLKSHFKEAQRHPEEYVKIYVYYFPVDYYNKSYSGVRLNQKELVFDKDRMTDLWNAGVKGQKDATVDSMVFDKANIDKIYSDFKRSNKNLAN